MVWPASRSPYAILLVLCKAVICDRAQWSWVCGWEPGNKTTASIAKRGGAPRYWDTTPLHNLGAVSSDPTPTQQSLPHDDVEHPPGVGLRS